MKKHLLLLLLNFQLSFFVIRAQAPLAIPYQAVARDNSGSLISNQTISLRFSIHETTAGGAIIYQETQSKNTNDLGLFTSNIGEGNIVIGTFSAIDWESGAKFIQVELDAAGGTAFTDMGTQQMLSVPYALNAANGNWTKSGSSDIYNSNNGNIGVGTSTPASSAKLEINSNSKGFLPPRMTSIQRDAILNPVAGLVVYCTNCCISGELQIYNGAVWTNIVGGEKCLPVGVSICSQIWMDKNLDVDHYRNGDPIPKVSDPLQWAALTTGAYCYYNNDSVTYAATYGKLYNWYAVNDPRGLAPAGWHIPSETEWSSFTNCLGGTFSGGAMKETGTTHWLSPNTGATNSSGFTALPGGDRNFDGAFYQIGNYAFFWSSTSFDNSNAWFHYLSWSGVLIEGDYFLKQDGFSVRCIRD